MVETLPEEVDEAALADAPRRRFPRWRAPQLATLVDEPHEDPGRLIERKLDGVRVLRYAGRVGTGFDREDLARLVERLRTRFGVPVH